jgi:hypothetical protein
MRIQAVTLCLVSAAGLAGCEATNLYVAHNTVVGVNGAMNADSRSGHVIIGYDRKFAAIVPKSAPPVDDGTGVPPDAHEAMSVLSCSDLEVKGIFLTGFTEYLATGIAAKRFAGQVKKDMDAAETRAAAPAAAPAEPGAATAPSKTDASRQLGTVFDCYLDEPE